MNSRIALFSAALTLAATAAVQSADWPRWRGPDLNGISKETGWSPKALNDEPKILWRAKIGMGFSSFVVADGRVFTTGNTADTDTLFAFDADTGKELWKHSYAEPLDPKYYDGGTSATPTVDGDTVYQLSRKGQLIALEAATGK
ncbi:MAG TPA: PQQ-binding-like beta-propeller repeat protein, partial [Verrucomicrobiae bacterium]|nr:PQQ-binding-like beta-propeller repeat protein [Verrucomicrobiae bacterium]